MLIEGIDYGIGQIIATLKGRRIGQEHHCRLYFRTTALGFPMGLSEVQDY